MGRIDKQQAVFEQLILSDLADLRSFKDLR